MAEELQNLLEKIKRDGVDKANADAAAIVKAAEAKAAAIVKAAQDEAAAAKTAAEADAKANAARAEETIRQAARDTVLKIEQAVTAMLMKLLAEDVDVALADPAVVGPLAAAAVQSLVAGEGKAEVAAGPKLVEALRAQLAVRGNITVVTDEASGTGFSVRLDGGRVEHDFTGPTVSAALAERLRPDLAALLK
ncbi:MAG: hypothetical protein IKO72_02910 [Kiritimatiellae bacterium]|nr:hypothetical protein [Kiritimatiellia bacterium]